MTFIWAALAGYALQWLVLPTITDQWTFLLGMECLTTAFLVTGVFQLCGRTTVLTQSALALWALNAWADVIKFAAWNYSSYRVDLSVPFALLFAGWLLHIVRRRYDAPSEEASPYNVALLIKRPSGMWEVVKALLGVPASSVCVCIGRTAWMYRRRSGKYEVVLCTDAVKQAHIVVDTGAYATPEIVDKLHALVGSPRGPIPCKCLWTIRGVLAMLGGKYAIKSWLDYIPGFYAMRVL